MEVLIGTMIPFAGTTLGAACVFFMKEQLSKKIQKTLMGFESGVMVAAAIWSLMIPAMEQVKELGKLAFLPACVGFWLGTAFLLLLALLIRLFVVIAG